MKCTERCYKVKVAIDKEIRSKKRALITGIMSLKIYFCGSIRAGRVDAPLYARLIEELKKYGTVLTEHVGDQNLLEKGQF